MAIMNRWTMALAATLVSLIAADARAQAPPAACGPATTTSTPGVVLQGGEHLALREIALLLAPTLWFSADEPLLAEGRPPIPSAHPCDAVSNRPVVYYQVEGDRTMKKQFMEAQFVGFLREPTPGWR
jgi:hypothetical protein